MLEDDYNESDVTLLALRIRYEQEKLRRKCIL